MKVEIGGGPEPQHPEFEQFDAIDWSDRTGLRYTVGDMRHLPYETGSVAEVFSSNTLEHASHRDTLHTLREWARVLRPDGRLTLVVPDVLGILADYEDGTNTWGECVERLYGAHSYITDFHQAGFTRREMPPLIEAAGLEVVSCVSSHAGGGITTVARKP